MGDHVTTCGDHYTKIFNYSLFILNIKISIALQTQNSIINKIMIVLELHTVRQTEGTDLDFNY